MPYSWLMQAVKNNLDMPAHFAVFCGYFYGLYPQVHAKSDPTTFAYHEWAFQDQPSPVCWLASNPRPRLPMRPPLRRRTDRHLRPRPRSPHLIQKRWPHLHHLQLAACFLQIITINFKEEALRTSKHSTTEGLRTDYSRNAALFRTRVDRRLTY